MIRILYFLFVFLIPATVFAFSDVEIRKVQQSLTDLDYRLEKIDGKLSEETATAIRQYQSDWNLTVTGEVSDELIARLDQKHSATKSRFQKAENMDCELFNELPLARDGAMVVYGACENGKLEGKASVVWRYMAQGQWQEDSYLGEYRGGKQRGMGTYAWSSGDRYEGQFVDEKQHSIGTYSWADGGQYSGEWLDDLHHGKGVYSWANGDRYEGDWREDLRHGKGVWTWVNGDRYEGDWNKNKQQGKGVYFWKDGNRYEGDWVNDDRNGNGILIWTNGDRYEGEWRDDKENGKGI